MPSRPQVSRLAAYARITRDEHVLLCRISARVHAVQGQWILPGGGVEFGEHPEATVVREVFEETGLNVRPTGLPRVHAQVRRDPDCDLHAVRLIYDAILEGGTLRPELDGSTDLCAWIPLAELDRLALHTVAAFALDRER